jgi:hypothetical protein
LSNNNDRIVYRRSDGDWINRKVDADKAAGLHGTQAEAIAEATQMLKNAGGGELIVKGLDGKIRSKDTIAPGNDPYPPKDTEH